MSKIPDPLKRRDVLYSKNTPSDVLREYGDLYLQEGKPNDAVEFFGQANHRKGLQRIKEMAIQEGDLFIFSRATEFLQEAVSHEDWRNLAERALEKGKYHFAMKCFEKISDREGIEKTREKIGETAQDQETL